MARILLIALLGAAVGALAAVLYAKAQYGPNWQGAQPVARMLKASQPGAVGNDIGIYSIFTGSYSVLIPEFLDNMRVNFLPDRTKRFYLVADNAETCRQLLESAQDVECAVKEHMTWPYATLYRWSFFRTSFHPPESMSHIFFLNANARCVDTVTDEILGPHTAVLHHMYEGKRYEEATFERNPISMAYVPPAAHVRYYGARFLGATRENFLRLCEALDVNTQIDESNHFIAAWHDESHWNAYVNMILGANEVKVLGSEYHFPEELVPGALGREDAESKKTGKVQPKIMYLNKAAHVPKFDASKSMIWQYNVGGEVSFGHPYMDLPAFRADVYRALNPDVADLDDETLRLHYLAHPETPYVHESPAFATLFDASAYMERYGFDSELEAKAHYVRVGVWSEEYGFPVRGCATPLGEENGDMFITYPFQKGSRLQSELAQRLLKGVTILEGSTPTVEPTNAPTGSGSTMMPTSSPTLAPTMVSTSSPTRTPTMVSTSSPTALQPNDDWARVASSQICAGGVPTPIPQNLRALLEEGESTQTTTDEEQKAATSADVTSLEAEQHRELAGGSNPTIQACFLACQSYFAPNNQQFYFNVITTGNTKTCQCCERCDQLVSTPGGQAFANCIVNQNLLVTRKATRAKPRRGKTLTVSVTVRGPRKVALSALALVITFPQAYASPAKASVYPYKGAQGAQRMQSSVYWPKFDLKPNQKRSFKAQLRIAPSTPVGTTITVQATVYQTAVSNTPYCPHPASPLGVKVSK